MGIKVTHNDRASWIKAIWEALDMVDMPEDMHDEVYTAMAWITEELGVEEETASEEKPSFNNGEYSFLIIRDTSGRGEKNMLRFNSAEERKEYVKNALRDHATAINDGEEDEEETLELLIIQMENGDVIHDEGSLIEYEFV